MSEEENTTNEMFVHQIDYETLKGILKNVTDVNMMITYNMPNKADSYKDDGFSLIKTLDSYINGDDNWRITKERGLKFKIADDKIIVGDWVINGSLLTMVIPKINSIVVITDGEATYKGAKEVTKILHLMDCISVSPLLLALDDEPVEGDENKYKLSVSYKPITME